MGLSLACKSTGFTINRSAIKQRVDAGTSAALRVLGARITDRAQRELRRANPADKQPRVLFSIETGPRLIISAEDHTPEIMLRSGRRIRAKDTSDLRLRLFQRSGRLAGVKRDLAPSEDIALREVVLARAIERELSSGELLDTFKDSVTG